MHPVMANANSSFFTQRPSARFIVPHAPLGERWLLVVHTALTAAFPIIRRRGFDLRNSAENTITNELENVLMNDLLNRGIVEGFDKQFFGRVTRGSEVENYNGEKISKKPDLLFHLQRENVLWDRRQDAIFAECKPVDRDHSLSRNYCAVGTDRAGVERFVIGDYAWAMHEAMIIGYVRDGFRIDPHLVDCLAEPKRHKSLGSPTKPISIFSSREGPQPLHRTRHDRRFKWSGTGPLCTSILAHPLWP